MANDAVFTLTFKTVAQLTGINQLTQGLQDRLRQVETFNQRIQSSVATLNSALGLLGLGIGLRELNQLGKTSLEVREQMAGWTLQILRGVDGSQQLIAELTKLNDELDRTTGVNQEVSRRMQTQLSLFGATGEQIKKLTVGIIDFAAARGKGPEEIAFLLSRSLAGEDVALSRLGIHLDKTKTHAQQVQALIEQLGKTSGTAKAIADASGGMVGFENAARDAKIALGDLVNLFRIPFLTGFVSGLQGARQNIDEIGKSYSAVGQFIFVTSGVIGDSIGGMFARAKLLAVDYYTRLQLLGQQIAQFVLGTVQVAIGGIVTLVNGAIDQLNRLAKFGASIANVASFGLNKIDTSGFDESAEAAKKSVDDFGKSITDKLGEVNEAVGKKGADALGEWKKNFEEMASRGPSALSDEGLEKLKAKYKTFVDSMSDIGKGVKPGSGVITGGDVGDGGAAAKKAATEALTEARFQLANAEQNYQIELQQTELLETQGAISAGDAEARRRTATQDYIAELERVKALLPSLIALQEAAGDTRGVAQLKLELGQVVNKILEAQIALSNTSFFGKIRAPLQQLTAEWGNLGKQIGGFLTQQFQSFASGASAVITGLIFKTGNLKQAIMQIGQSFVQALIQMLIQWVLSRTIMSALNKAFGAADASAASAQAGAAAAAWAPAATAASIASYGVAAGLGVAAFLSAIGIGTAGAVAAAGVGGVGAGGFAAGGFTGGREGQIAGFVHGEEIVVPAPRVRALGKNFLLDLVFGGMDRPGYATGGFVGPASAGGSGVSSPRGGDTSVYNFFDREKMMKQMRADPAFRKIFVDVFNDVRVDLGAGS